MDAEPPDAGPGWTAVAALAVAAAIGGVWLWRAQHPQFSALLYELAVVFAGLAVVCLALFVPAWWHARRRSAPQDPQTP